MVGIAEDSVQLRSFRTLPTFPAWSSTTCLRRAPLFGSQCLRRKNSRSMIAPWQMVPGGPSHFVGPFFLEPMPTPEK